MDIQSYGRGFKSARNVDIFTILYTSKLKAPGSNPLNNSIKVPGGGYITAVRQFALASVFIIIMQYKCTEI